MRTRTNYTMRTRTPGISHECCRVTKREMARRYGYKRADRLHLRIINTPYLLNELNLINWNYRARYFTPQEVKLIEKYFG